MKKQIIFYCLLVSFTLQACMVPEQIQNVTRTLTQRERMYAQRRTVAQICLAAGAGAVAGVILYNWYTQPLLTPGQAITLFDIKAIAANPTASQALRTLNGNQTAPVAPSWLWKHMTGFSSFVAQTSVAGVVSMGLQQAYAQGNQFLYPRVTRAIASSPYLMNVYRTALEGDQLVHVNVPLDLDFLITHADMVEYAVNNGDASLLPEAGHGILGCLDYVVGRMKNDPATSRALVRELTKLRGVLATQLEDLYTRMQAQPCNKADLWTAHEEFCATIKKLSMFELLRI